MLSDMLWERVSITSSTRYLQRVIDNRLLVASNVGLASAIVGIVVILSLDQRFYLGSGSIKL